MKVCVIGSLNVDHVLYVNNFPKPGETVRSKGYEQHFGGKGGNQAVACAKLGLEVSMVGAINTADLGKLYIDHLKTLKVNTKMIKASDAHTGYAFIEVDKSGENKIVTAGGANYTLDLEWINHHIEAILDHDIFMFSLEIPQSIVEYIMPLLYQAQKKVILDPAPIDNFSHGMLNQNLYLTPNDTELEILQQYDMKDMKIIMKKGAEGSAFKHHDILIHQPAHRVDVIDTVGAGDTFNAGLAYGLSKNLPMDQVLDFANACGALATTKRGAQAGMPTLEDVQKLIKPDSK